MSIAKNSISGESLTREVRMRFASNVHISVSGCHEWQRALNRQGYGRFKLNGVMLLAHRVAFAIANDGLGISGVLDHLCRNRSCVNPDHLELVSQAENTARGMSPVAQSTRKALDSGKCVNGHERNEENRRFTGGEWRCIPCEKTWRAAREKTPQYRERRAEKSRRYRARLKAMNE